MNKNIVNTDELYYWTVETLKGLIAIPSISREEDKAVDYLLEQLKYIGIEAERTGNNLVARSTHFCDKKKTILLVSHIDTVRPVAGWSRPPYQATEEGVRIYGLGSNDAGASLVTMAATFAFLTQYEQAYNLIYMCSCQEEVSGTEGMEMMRDLLPEVDFAIVGEPTQMCPAIAEKGLLVLDCEVKGRSGHAAREEGENALIKAIQVIQRMHNYPFERVSPLVGPVKCSVTMINAGTQHNVVPDSCSFVVDVRTNELYSNEEVFELLQRAFPDCSIKARSFRLNSSRIEATHPYVERCRLLGLNPYGSPTMSDQAFLKCPSLKMGVGDSARSHTADEYITTDELREGLSLYIKLLSGLQL